MSTSIETAPSRSVWGVLTAIFAAAVLATSLFAAPATAAEPAPTRSSVALTQTQTDGPAISDPEPLPTEVRDQLLAEHADALVAHSGLTFDLDRAEALQAGDLQVLRVPAAPDQGVIEPSSLSVIVDANGAQVSVIETAFSPSSDSSGDAKIWTDGQLTFDQVVNESDPIPNNANDAVSTLMSSGVTPLNDYVEGDWWGNLNKCLSAAGIAGWTITALAIACSAACIGTAGVLCVPCLVALTGGAAGTVSFCVREATYYS
jgi:hypothetical protein